MANPKLVKEAPSVSSKGPPVRRCGQLSFQVTLKFPLPVTFDGFDATAPFLTMTIFVGLDDESGEPSTVAPVNNATPKSVNGRTSAPFDGASAMIWAEMSFAFG
jgi:hypothetical protein